VSPAALTRLRAAAALRHQDVTSFVLGAALERARDVVADEHRTRLRITALSGSGRAFADDPDTPDDGEPDVPRDPDDPDDDLWDDPLVTRDPPSSGPSSSRR
jgi:uncharacterized protein (DUF1778 family)